MPDRVVASIHPDSQDTKSIVLNDANTLILYHITVWLPACHSYTTVYAAVFLRDAYSKDDQHAREISNAIGLQTCDMM